MLEAASLEHHIGMGEGEEDAGQLPEALGANGLEVAEIGAMHADRRRSREALEQRVVIDTGGNALGVPLLRSDANVVTSACADGMFSNQWNVNFVVPARSTHRMHYRRRYRISRSSSDKYPGLQNASCRCLQQHPKHLVEKTD